MKKILFGLALMASVTTVMAQASTSSCSMISNDDSRNYCMAKVSGNQGYCSSINNDDRRHYCQAVATRQPFKCETINDSDRRAMCKADAR